MLLAGGSFNNVNDGNFEYVNAMGFQDLSHASGSFNFVNAIGTAVMLLLATKQEKLLVLKQCKIYSNIIGSDALGSTTADIGTVSDVIAIGKEALKNNKDADNNIAIGIK